MIFLIAAEGKGIQVFHGAYQKVMNRLHDWHEKKKNEHNRKVKVKQICSIVLKDLIKLIKLHCDFLERFSHGKNVYFDPVKLVS